MWQWYAVFCRPGQDQRAEIHFLNQGFETFRPKIRFTRRRNGTLRDRVDSLFPRYLFLRLEDLTQDWAPIRSTRGAVGLVRLGDQVPVVPESLIDSLKVRTDEQGIVDLSAGVDFQPGEAVEIMEGPLAGFHGLFQARNGEERIVVLLNLMQGECRTELPRHSVRSLRTG